MTTQLEHHQRRLLARSVRNCLKHASSRWSTGNRRRALRDVDLATRLCATLVEVLRGD